MPKILTCPKCGTPYYGRPRRCTACGCKLRTGGKGGEAITILGLLVVVGALLWVAFSSDGAPASPPSEPPAAADPPAGTGRAPEAPTGAAQPPDLKTVIEQVKHVVVRIDVRLTGTKGAIGSGFVCDRQGWVLTNQHVVDGARQVSVTTADGRQWPATVLHADAEHDLALLNVPGLAGTDPLAISASGHLGQGDRVVAIGSPEGLTNTVSEGIISALNRKMNVSGREMEGLIQTTAPISHGSSGGPLVELRTAKVIGVTTAGSDTGSNLGFAVSGDTILRVMQSWTRR